MASSPITIPPFPCYVAMRSRDTAMGDNGWIPPDLKKVVADIPRAKVSATNAATGPPDTSYFTPVSDFSTGVAREYGNISSGGPLVAGRAELGDVSISKDINNMTPVLFLYCSNGHSFEYVHFHFVISSDKVMNMVLSGVNVSGHEITGASGEKANSNSESFTLWYSKMSMEVQQLYTAKDATAADWHSGANKGWDRNLDRAA